MASFVGSARLKESASQPKLACNSSNESKARKPIYAEDKPLRYLLMYTHTLIANYDDILKDSWIRSLRYIINASDTDKQHTHALIADLKEFLNGLELCTFVEDDLIDKIFAFITQYQSKLNLSCVCLNSNLKYDLIQIKDKFFEDNMHRMELKQGIRIFLRELKETLKWTLCLIHKDSRETYNMILNDIGLRGYFNAFVCAPSIANYSRPYKQLYEQSISRSRIFKQQCMVLTNHASEALESIHFGIHPILVTECNVRLYGKYFCVQYRDEWIEPTLQLLAKIKDEQNNMQCLKEFVSNDECFEAEESIVFLNDNGKIYGGMIEKLIIPFPVKIYRIKYKDSDQKTQIILRQSYLLWKK